MSKECPTNIQAFFVSVRTASIHACTCSHFFLGFHRMFPCCPISFLGCAKLLKDEFPSEIDDRVGISEIMLPYVDAHMKIAITA